MMNVDQDKLRARHLTTEDVHQAIEKQKSARCRAGT